MPEKLKILVVDDKKVIGDLFDFTLGYKGHAITIVENGKDAFHAVQKDIFDVAFVDIVMPEIDGVQVLKEIRKLDPRLPIIMMSGYSVDMKKNAAKEMGAVGFLKKPFEMEDIRRIIKLAVGKDI